MNQGSNFLRGCFSNIGDARPQFHLKDKANYNFLKCDFSSRIDPFFFMSMAQQTFE